MSFDTMKREELNEIAPWFAVDPTEAPNKAVLLQLLEDEGVTWDMYQAEFKRRNPDVEPEPEVVEVVEEPVVVVQTAPVRPTTVNTYLIKMDRSNTYYETFGKVFTKDHPFALVDEKTARNILEKDTGFHIATPGEAEAYYG